MRATSLLLLLTLLTPARAQAFQEPADAPPTFELNRHERRLRSVTIIPRLSPKGKGQQSSEAEYERATMSFEFGTRDDTRDTLNDWDIQITHWDKRPIEVHVNMVTDDRSGIVDAGMLALDKATARGNLDYDPDADLPILLGHTYVVHTKDTNTDQWARFRVIAFEGRGVVIIWEVISAKSVRSQLTKWKRAESKRIKAEAARQAREKRAARRKKKSLRP